MVTIYLCGQFEQTRFIYDTAVSYVDQAKTLVTNNWSTLVAGGGVTTAVTTAGVALNKINTVKQQASNALSSANSQISELKQKTAEKEELLNQVNIEKESLNAQMETLSTQKDAIASQVERQRVEMEVIYKQNAADFQSAIPTNTVVTDPVTGKQIIKVIEKVLA